jgi:hypothetical protein
VPVTPRTVRTTAPLELMATPDRRRRLSDGVLVDASIRARLLGIRLLTIDATIVLAPADVTAPLVAAHDPPRRAPVRSFGISRNRSAATGHGLAEAVRSINEGAELLAESRRDGS